MQVYRSITQKITSKWVNKENAVFSDLFEDPVEVSGPFLTGSGERMGRAAL